MGSHSVSKLKNWKTAFSETIKAVEPVQSWKLKTESTLFWLQKPRIKSLKAKLLKLKTEVEL